MKRLLITCFEPFGGSERNASQMAVAALPDTIFGYKLHRLCLPVVFGSAGEQVAAAIGEIRPDAVICVGEAGGRAAITPERIAVNLDDTRIPDNAGEQPVDRPIAADGPAAYFSTLPVKRMAEAVRAAGVPAAVSYTAGTFVCNHLMYALLHWCGRHAPDTRAGFMHVPYQLEQTAGRPGVPGLSRGDILHGTEAAVRAIIEELILNCI